MILSEDQRKAVGDILKEAYLQQVLTLTGPAGSGKSTLMRFLAKEFQSQGRYVRFAAPTGKAAFRLREVGAGRATTLHSLLYGMAKNETQYSNDVDWVLLERHAPGCEALVREALETGVRYLKTEHAQGKFFDTQELKYVDLIPGGNQPFHSPTAPPPETELVFGAPRFEIQPRDVLVVDEASMVNEDLHDEIMNQLPVDATLLYVGDREQLPPVNGRWGPDFENPTAVLREVHRQAQDNPIIQIATKIRQGGPLEVRAKPPAYERIRARTDAIAGWEAKKIQEGEDIIVLCYTRKVRARINERVRERLELEGPVVVGERLKVAKNNKTKGRVNGELVHVEKVKPFEGNDRGELIVVIRSVEGAITSALTQPSLFGEDQSAFYEYCRSNHIYREEAANYLHFDYGYACTVHSAQGSEFDEVGFVNDWSIQRLKNRNPEEARRLLYTAVTRAVHRLTVFDHG